MFEELVNTDPRAAEAALRDYIAERERIKAAAAADQARAAVEWAALRQAMGATASRRGLASEIGLARRDSPHRGQQCLAMATILVADMPHTLAALEAGLLSEWRADLISREAACLSPADRRQLDTELCGDPSSLEGLGTGKLTAAAKRITYRLDDEAVTARARRAVQDRNVTFRPAPDGMAYVSVLVSAADGRAVHTALRVAVHRCTDGRSRGQVMADTLVQRVTGRDTRAPIPVSVNVVLSDQTLLGGQEPAHLEGYGPIPATMARRMIRAATLDDRSKATLRKLYAAPASGALVAMESKSRLFPKGLARFIATRDQTCRTPYCDAPIRHLDHAHPHHRHGPTSAINGQGTCAHCNYVKEEPGWKVRVVTNPGGRHTTEHTTPTGATYRSTAPPIPGGMRVLTRDIHVVTIKRTA